MAAGTGPIVVAAIVTISHSHASSSGARLSRIGSVWLLAWLAVATVKASRAARASRGTEDNGLG